MGGTKKNLDPLFQLFEAHLLTRSYEDSAAFTKEVAKEYFNYIDSTFAHVPLHVRANVLEDLESETHEMLIKKMYGVVKSGDYVNFGKVIRIGSGKNDRLGVFEFLQGIATEESDPKSKR